MGNTLTNIKVYCTGSNNYSDPRMNFRTAKWDGLVMQSNPPQMKFQIHESDIQNVIDFYRKQGFTVKIGNHRSNITKKQCIITEYKS